MPARPVVRLVRTTACLRAARLNWCCEPLARDPAERRYEAVALGAQHRQVVGSRLVRRRVVDDPVVPFDYRHPVYLRARR